MATPFRLSTDVIYEGTATTTVTLHELAAIVDEVKVLALGTDTTVATYSLAGGTIVTGTPTASEVQFTGTPDAPSSTLTFGADIAAPSLVIVTYVVDGDAVQ